MCFKGPVNLENKPECLVLPGRGLTNGHPLNAAGDKVFRTTLAYQLSRHRCSSCCFVSYARRRISRIIVCGKLRMVVMVIHSKDWTQEPVLYPLQFIFSTYAYMAYPWIQVYHECVRFGCRFISHLTYIWTTTNPKHSQIDTPEKVISIAITYFKQILEIKLKYIDNEPFICFSSSVWKTSLKRKVLQIA